MEQATKDAFKTLGLPEDADLPQIRAKRSLLISLHPDAGGDEDEFMRYSEAYERAYDYALGTDVDDGEGERRPPGDIVRKRAVREFGQISQEPVGAVVKDFVRVHVDPLRQRQRQAATFTGLGVAIATTVGAVSAATSLVSGGTVLAVTVAVLAGATVIVGWIVWVLQSRVERLQSTIDSAVSFLAQRPSFHAALTEILTSTKSSARGEQGKLVLTELSDKLILEAVTGWIDRAPVEAAVSADDEPLSGIAQRLGTRAFVNLLIAQGLENGLLIEREQLDQGRLVSVYEFETGITGAVGETNRPH